MFKQASISHLRRGELTPKQGYLVVCMAYYPRGLTRAHLDEYRQSLAPDRKLFQDWKMLQTTFGHNQAFDKADYEARFKLSEKGLDDLDRLSQMAKTTDVYLVCQCVVGERCHREMLLLLARQLYGAPIEEPHNQYPRFLERFSRPSDLEL